MEQFPFMMIARIKKGQEQELEHILHRMGRDVKGKHLDKYDDHVHLDFTKSLSTHFARLVILEDPDAGISRRRLLLSTNYDGSLENHLKELDDICTNDIHKAIWERLEDYTDKQHFKEFLRSENAKINVDTFYVGIRGETVEKIHQYIDARHEFDKQPNRSYWRTYNYAANDPSTKLHYFSRGLFALLAVTPFLLLHLNATIKTLKTIFSTGLPLDPAGEDYSNAILEDCLETIPCLKDHVPPTAVTVPHKPEKVVGEDVIAQNQMNVITDVRPEDLEQLKVFLKFVNAGGKGFTGDGELLGISTIHFARWVLIDNEKRLLFLSNYDGSWENYIGDFSDKGYKGLDAAWMSSQGYPGSQDIQAFKQYIRCRQVQSHYFYSAYRHETVQNIMNDRVMAR